MATKVKKGEKI